MSDRLKLLTLLTVVLASIGLLTAGYQTFLLLRAAENLAYDQIRSELGRAARSGPTAVDEMAARDKPAASPAEHEALAQFGLAEQVGGQLQVQAFDLRAQGHDANPSAGLWQAPELRAAVEQILRGDRKGAGDRCRVRDERGNAWELLWESRSQGDGLVLAAIRPGRLRAHFAPAIALGLGATAILVAAGATLVVRVTGPFIRRLEESTAQLEAKAEELGRTNRQLDDFTYLASHDMKEPLRGISAYCEMLREDYADRLDETARVRLEALVRLCDRLARLIDDMLDWCRIGRQRLQLEPVDLNRLVAGVVEVLAPAVEHRGARVVVRPLPTVLADATQLAQAFHNLIANALKFNDAAEPRIEIGSMAQSPHTVYVRDNGIGIAPEYQEAVFEMFRRLHPRSKYEGTGAGLAIVRRVMESHGGGAWVESTPGAGSMFYLSFSGQTAGETPRREEFQASLVPAAAAMPSDGELAPAGSLEASWANQAAGVS